MAECSSKIVKDIISNCTTQGSPYLEAKAWIFDRETYKNAITYDATNANKITAIASVEGEKAYVIYGAKKMLTARSEIVTSLDRDDRYNHFFEFHQFEGAAADLENVDRLNDFFVVVEMVNKFDDGDGTFLAFGVKNGLWKTESTWNSNENDAARSIVAGSLEGAPELYSKYVFLSTDYATTKAALVALETTGV